MVGEMMPVWMDNDPGFITAHSILTLKYLCPINIYNDEVTIKIKWVLCYEIIVETAVLPLTRHQG